VVDATRYYRHTGIMTNRNKGLAPFTGQPFVSLSAARHVLTYCFASPYNLPYETTGKAV
jgi:hypothetical protein